MKMNMFCPVSRLSCKAGKAGVASAAPHFPGFIIFSSARFLLGVGELSSPFPWAVPSQNSTCVSGMVSQCLNKPDRAFALVLEKKNLRKKYILSPKTGLSAAAQHSPPI